MRSLFVLATKVVAIALGFSPAMAQTAPDDIIGIVDLRKRFTTSSDSSEFDFNANAKAEFEVAIGSPSGYTTDVRREEFAYSEIEKVEIGDDAYAVLVSRIYQDWISIEVGNEINWIRLEPGERFTPVETIIDSFKGGFLTRNTIQVSDYPGGPTRTVTLVPKYEDQNVTSGSIYRPDIILKGRADLVSYNQYHDPTFHRYRKTDRHEVWLQIELPEEDGCSLESKAASGDFTSGWVRFRELENEEEYVTFWLTPGGC